MHYIIQQYIKQERDIEEDEEENFDLPARDMLGEWTETKEWRETKWVLLELSSWRRKTSRNETLPPPLKRRVSIPLFLKFLSAFCLSKPPFQDRGEEYIKINKNRTKTKNQRLFFLIGKSKKTLRLFPAPERSSGRNPLQKEPKHISRFSWFCMCWKESPPLLVGGRMECAGKFLLLSI